MLNASSCLTAVFSKMKLRPRLRQENAAKKAAKKAAKADNAIVTPQMEKTTLGDINALAALKEKLDAEKK